MTIEPKKLVDIFKQLDEQFSSHKIISTAPIKGDPPHIYEITYTISGLTLADGKETQRTHHVIECSIPFGFPHFPPSCKPKSDIFHPDFDPAAICLGNFWEQNQSLPSLIIHIGRMISGEFYSTDNAFNEQAAIWYTQHKEELPFSTALAPTDTTAKYDEIARENSEKAADLVVNLPDIPEKADRVKKKRDLPGSESLEHEPEPQFWSDKTATQDEPAQEFLSNQKNQDPAISPVNFAQKPTRRLYQRTRLLFFILSQVLLIGGGTGGYFYVKSQKEKLISAEYLYSQCLTQLETDNFSAAKDSCEKALRLSEDTIFLLKNASSNHISKIKKILYSEKLQQGLAGKILVDGQYLTKKEAETMADFKKLSDEGSHLFKQSQWNPAKEKLQKALNIIHNNSYLSTTTVPDLTFKLQQTKLQILLLNAAEKLNNKNWKEAIKSSHIALTYLNEFPEKIQQQYKTQLQQNIARCQFQVMKDKADRFFTDSDWPNAISCYQRLLVLGKTDEHISQETLLEISENIKRSKLYHAISSGSMAFTSGSWDDAISAYKNARSLLADNTNSLSSTDSNVNIRKLEKVILQTSIIKERQAAKTFLEKNNLQAAKNSHKKIIQQIEASAFADNSNFREITAKSTESIQSLEREIFLNKSRIYLETKYQDFFTAHFSDVSPDNLSHPVITLEEETPENFLFKIQCTKTAREGHIFLVMHYIFDKKTQSWKFSS